jgi:hypothetical protein
VIISERTLRSIIRKAFVKSVLQEIAFVDGIGHSRYVGMDPTSSRVKNIPVAWALSDFLGKVRMAHAFVNKTQQYKKLGPGELAKAWNAADPTARELLGILDDDLMPYLKGVSTRDVSKLESLLDWDSSKDSKDRIEKLIKHTSHQSVEELNRYLNKFDELIEDSGGDGQEVLDKLEGVGAVQREMMKFLIDKVYGRKIFKKGAKKLSSEQEEHRRDIASLFKLRADREHERWQQQAQRTRQIQDSEDATPPQGIKKPKQ